MEVIKIDSPWAFGVGIIGNIISFMVTLSPVMTFYRIYKKKSTESFQSIPYVVALFSSMLWLYYALLTQDILLLTINSACCIAQSIYLAIYIIYAPKKPRGFTLKLILFLEVGLFGSLVLLTLNLLKGRRRIDVVGWMCASCAVSVFAAPLSIIRLVIRTKSVEYMPFPLTFFLTVSAVVWFTYGLLLKDFFVALPNVVGFTLGVTQMIFYFVYMHAKSCTPEANNTNIVADAARSTTLNLEMIVVEKKITLQSLARENRGSASEA